MLCRQKLIEAFLFLSAIFTPNFIVQVLGDGEDGKGYGDPRPNVFGHGFSPLVDRQGIVNGKDLRMVMLWQGKEIIGFGSKRKATQKIGLPRRQITVRLRAYGIYSLYLDGEDYEVSLII